jgi:hypothetical protein
VRRLIAFALAVAACKGGDRSDLPANQNATATATVRGPDALLLRVPRNGGIPRVTVYSNPDSVVWTATDAAPAIDRVLAFDPDAGLIAAADSRGAPLWIDLHTGAVTRPGKGPLRNLTSVDGSTIYGVGADGAVARVTPAGSWVFKPPLAARAVFPQSAGTILVLAGRGKDARVWRMYPPETRLRDSLMLADALSGTGASLGDIVYFTRPSGALVSVRPRTMAVSEDIELGHGVRAVVTTPSGDRAYVITDSANTLFVVDRYRNEIVARTTLPGRARELRVDPFGRYLLARAATGDSLWVVAVGTHRITETLHSQWRGDLPFVTVDGAIALTDGRDVVFHATRGDARIAGGAADYWYPFLWNGLRPRAAALDQPAKFATDSDTAAVPAAPVDTQRVGAPAAVPDSVRIGFTVSFAVLLDEPRARDEASKIVINGQPARVVTGMAGGTAMYRVVAGPFPTREEAERAGKSSGRAYVVYAGAP